MKYPIIGLAVAAAISAQSIADLQAKIPKCAQTCLDSAIAATSCSSTDLACQCGPARADIIASATPCITEALGTPDGCTVPEALSVQPLADQICALVTASSVAYAVPTSSAAVSLSPTGFLSMTMPDIQTPATSGSSLDPTTATSASTTLEPYPSMNGTWSTIYSATTYTITSCEPTVTYCPAGEVTTKTISVYTTFCPYTSLYLPSPAPSPAPIDITTVGPASTVGALVPSGVSNGTLATPGKVTPTPTSTGSPVEVTGAAGGLRVCGALGFVAMLVAVGL